MTDAVNEPHRDNTPSERWAVQVVEANPPTFSIDDQTALDLFAATSSRSDLDPAAHGAGIVIRASSSTIPTCFTSGSDRDDCQDTWADRGQLGAVLIALEWLERYAGSHEANIAPLDRNYVYQHCVLPLKAIPADDVIGLQAFLTTKSGGGPRANGALLMKMHRLLHTMPHVSWKAATPFDAYMKQAKALAKKGCDEAYARLSEKGIQVRKRQPKSKLSKYGLDGDE
jgi:hypothetical protein